MIATALLLAAICVAVSPPPASPGIISGIVVNASRDEQRVPGSQVFLQVQRSGEFVPVAETTTDQQGTFRFDGLLIDGDGLYLPGANRGGVHYPGPRIPLTSDRPHARVKLLVCDATSGPSPLRISGYSISIDPRPGALTVTEAMSIENPTSLCYVGETPAADGQPVTLRLAVPPEFERTTFHKEFFGRQFSIAGDKLVTGVPWPPGKRELAFTYVLACNQKGYVWRRPLDLPCRSLHLAVRANDVGGVSANLVPVTASRPGEVCFASTGVVLPAGDTIEVTFGHLPAEAMAYGSTVALITLVGLIAGAAAELLRRGRRDARS